MVGVLGLKLDGVLVVGRNPSLIHNETATAGSKCYNHGTDSLHYAILISRTGLVIFFQPT